MTGSAFTPSTEVDLYICRHVPLDDLSGAIVADISTWGPHSVLTAGDGGLPITSVGLLPTGEYNLIADINQNGIFDDGIDRIDRAQIGIGILPDCNFNGVSDWYDIHYGSSTDNNENNIPDDCEYTCGMYTDGRTGNANCDDQGKLNLADITVLITRVYLDPSTPLCCEANGDVNCDSKLNLSDITDLITKVYLDTAFELCECP